MADVHVSTFADLITAIAVAGDNVYIDDDLDAQSEGIDSVTSFQIKCNLYGQGHTISNLLVLGNICISVIGSSTVHIEDVYFKNFGVKYSGTTIGINVAGRYYCYFKRCKFSLFVSCGNNAGLLSAFGSYAGLYFDNCAFDVTLAMVTTFSGNGNYTLCNVVVRNGQFTSGIITLSSQTYVDWVFVDCNIAGNISLGGAYSYIALKGCTTTAGNIAVSGPANCLFCDASGVTHTVTTIQEVTEAQLQSENYLQSIGFLP